MHYKTGRQNHDFQIAYFLVGSCKTADAAYALLHDQFEDRDNAIKMFEGSKLREKAKRLKAEATIKRIEDRELDVVGSGVPLTVEEQVEMLEAQAEISDINAMAETTARNLAAAIAERDFIQLCMERLQPLRKYSNLADPEAFQAAQREEWKLELAKRIENCMMSHGHIPTDQLDTIRMHPDFETELLPYMEGVQAIMRSTGDIKQVLAFSKTRPQFDVMEALQLPKPEDQPTLPGPADVPALALARPDFSRKG